MIKNDKDLYISAIIGNIVIFLIFMFPLIEFRKIYPIIILLYFLGYYVNRVLTLKDIKEREEARKKGYWFYLAYLKKTQRYISILKEIK